MIGVPPGTRKIRILYIISSLGVGGAENQLVQLATGLDRERYEAAVCCLSSAGPFREPLDEARIPVMTVGFAGFGGFWRNPRGVLGPLLRLVRLIRRFRPDIVQSSLFWAYILGCLAAKLAGVSIVITGRRIMEDFKASHQRYLLLDGVVNHLTDVVIANSEAVRKDTILHEHLGAEKVGVIYNGIDADRYLVAPDDEVRRSAGVAGRQPVVVVLASLSARKGHRFFLEAWASVVSIYPNAVALLVGDGELRGELESKVVSAGMGDSVRILGIRSDVPELLALTDLVVQPSLAEGFSNAILEAMAAAKPVVATAVGGNAEAVVDGVTGLVVPPGDSRSLAEAMLWLMEHPAQAFAFGRAGRARVVEHFGLQTMVRRHEELYERLVSEKGS